MDWYDDRDENLYEALYNDKDESYKYWYEGCNKDCDEDWESEWNWYEDWYKKWL